MTEGEFRRRWPDERPGDDLRARLAPVDEALLAIAGDVANGQTPADELERDRCRLVAERIASKGRSVVDLLARPPAGSPRLAVDHAGRGEPCARALAAERLVNEALAEARAGSCAGLTPEDRGTLVELAHRVSCTAATLADEVYAIDYEPDELDRALADSTEARVVAETNRVIDEARDREQGKEP